MPLRVKLVVAMMSLVAVGLAVAGFAATTVLHGYLIDRVDDRLRTAQAGDRFVGDGHGGPRPPGDDHASGRLPSEFYVQTSSATGAVIDVQSNPLHADDAAPKIPVLTTSAAAARAGKPFTVGSLDSGDGEWRVLVRTTSSGESVAVATRLAEESNTLTRLIWIEVVVGGLVIAVLAGLGYFVIRRSLRPLVEVEGTAEAIAAGDLTQRVPERDPRTEVGRLSRALNGMLAQIESAFHAREASETAARDSEERMRRFVADASHELRTPLTSIRGFAELYRQGAVGDKKAVERVMRRIEDEAARMGLLVEDLLMLARLDEQRPLVYLPVDLLGLAADAVHDATAIGPDHPTTLDVLPGEVAPIVAGDEARLRQVVSNLVTNAVVHTPPGTLIAVRVGTEDGHAVLHVVDHGPGLAQAEADRVFERFYRADPSRTRTSGGSGLGLSIVAALVAAHGGSVRVSETPGGGATFVVRLPLYAAAAELSPADPVVAK
ncbi:MAG: two-component system, OmpR family, sensor kinase [Frankiales bacterium]|jgi:two-component system OmpR family sensor kinase|nr:two-component system, OmpR family, sensor kinase [Frankiales bacterium]